ncbi:MAG: crossover junction endodeoxyribonuclease RuvC [Candidatus Campbellbacteria bacterium]|nr:crossover junction endodeoxyribonuclease RuvC [Candidatus Campbellbacteria bacterium]
MKVLGIDPGYGRLGISVLEGDRQKQRILFSECFVTDSKEDFSKRLLKSIRRVEAICTEYAPDAVALETLFFSNNQKTAMNVAEVRGALVYLAEDKEIPLAQYSPQEIKMAVSGYGKSSKADIATMLTKLLVIPKKKMLDDEYDAIGVALTHLVSAKH